MKNEKHIRSATGAGLECAQCGSSEVETRYELHHFTYGTGAQAVELEAEVPVRYCRACDFSYLDEEAEDIRHETVCRHLNVLTPTQISDLRARYNLSRGEFARLTRLGEATLARWENGIKIQNAAYDCYLRLLLFSDNVGRLRSITTLSSTSSDRHSGHSTASRFRALSNPESLRYEARHFTLIKAAA